MKSRLRNDSSDFVSAMDQVQHLQREVDDEGVKQVLGDGVHAAHVDGRVSTFMEAMYSSSTAAIPDTMAENRNTIGISGVDHHGFALMEPKMNPTYPCSRNADGMPITVTAYPTLSSNRSAAGLTFIEPRVSIR